MTVTVKFEVLDMHPGRGHVRECVYEETQKYEIENPAIIPGAGKHYSELFKKWNGCGAAVKSLCGKNRYEVRFYTI